MRRSRWDEWVEPDRSAPKLEPAFGVKAWGRLSTCADVHPHGPMPEKTRLCCMACHQAGARTEANKDLEITAADKIELQRWQPRDEKGRVVRDRWSGHDRAAAEPTTYQGPPTAGAARSRRVLKQFRRSIRPIDPTELAREVEADRAQAIA